MCHTMCGTVSDTISSIASHCTVNTFLEAVILRVKKLHNVTLNSPAAIILLVDSPCSRHRTS